MARMSDKEKENRALDYVNRQVNGSRRGNGGTNMGGQAVPYEERARVFRELWADVKHWQSLPPVRSDDDCAERIADYFERCAAIGTLPTVEGLAIALGITRKALWEWGNGTQGTNRSNLVKRAKEIIFGNDALLVSNGMMNPVVYIFRAKNFAGLVDSQTISFAQADNNNTSETATEEELARKYLGAMPGDDE